MPVPRHESPEFSPTGQYYINVADRKLPGETRFHDVENFSEACNEVPPTASNMAHFQNKKWAIQRGYIPCPVCME